MVEPNTKPMFYCNPKMQTYPRGKHVLGIETSCDDTGVAVLRGDGEILSNCINSQLKTHLDNGGIIPMIAKECHVNNIDQVANRAFRGSGLKSVARDIDAIAVTTRPGLDHSLQVGLNYARQLAKKYSKPLIPIHHMQAHALMPLLENRSIRFPFMVLLISGGHCLLSICERFNKFHLLGTASDGSPGEVLDKFARRLRLKNLGEPFDRISGGAAVELMGRRANADRFKYFNDESCIPMSRRSGCDFSFSGYFGNIEKLVPMVDDLWDAGNREKLQDELAHLCGSLQRAIYIQLFRKLQRAMMFYRMRWRYENPQAFHQDASRSSHLGFGIRNFEDSGCLDVVVSGGVAANTYITTALRSACSTDLDAEINLYAPSKGLCSDNGLMIAWNGMLRFAANRENPEEQVNNVDLQDSLVRDASQMDLIGTIASCPIGLDLTKQVEGADFKLPQTRNSELKLRPRNTLN